MIAHVLEQRSLGFKLPLARMCELLGIARATIYRKLHPAPPDPVEAQLRQRIQWLHPGIALSINDPGGVALNVFVAADFRLRCVGPTRTAFDIGNAIDRTVKKFFLLRAVRAP